MSEYTYKRTNHSDGSVMSEAWWKDDRRHRDNDKPARIYYRKDGSVESKYWWKEGVKYTPRTDTCNGKTVEIDGKTYKLILID